MATITNLTGAVSTVNGTTVAASGALTVAVNDWLVVFVACPNSGAGGAAPTITVADSDGLNVYTRRATINYDPGSAGDGTTLAVFTCPVTDAVTSGDITATLSDAAGSKAIQVYRMRPGTGEVIAFVAVDATGNTGNGHDANAGPVTVTNGDTIFAGASVETNGIATGDSDTTNGSWSAIVSHIADNGTDPTSTSVISQYKTVTATGSQSWAATYGGSNDFAGTYVVLRAAKTLTAAPGSYTITGTNAGTLRGRKTAVSDVGSYVITGTDPTLSKSGAKAVNVEPGSYTITGTDPSTIQAYKPTAGVGSYAITGTDTPTLHGWVLAPDAGSYAITGTDTPTLQARKLVPDAGSYAINGVDQGLVKSGTFVITALSGSYTITGTDASPIHGYVLAQGAGSYALTGTNATPLHVWASYLNTPGSYLITGTGVTLTKTQAAPIQIRANLFVAPFSHSLIVRRLAGSLSIDSHTFGLKVDARTPALGVESHTHTLKVR